MYNDENNLYNYTYRKDGSELSHQRETIRPGGQQPGPQGPEIIEVKPVKKNRLGLKITALALSCALLGGAAGGGAVWAASHYGGETRAGATSPAVPPPRWLSGMWTEKRP